MSLCCSPLHSTRTPDSAWSWLVCFSGCLSLALVFGTLQCFAVVMPVLMDYFDETRTKTAWVGSIAMGLVFFCMPLSAMVITRLNIRYTAILGTLMCITSLVVTSFTQNLFQVFFSYSILYGLGFSLLFTSCVFATTKYFIKRQAIAIGIVNGGTYIGVLSLGPTIQLLIDLYGFRTMYRIMAGSFVLVLLAVLSFDPNVKAPATERTQDKDNEDQPAKLNGSIMLELFKTPMYMVAVIVLTLQAMAAFVSFVHLVSYCREVDIVADKASKLFTAIGVCSLTAGILAGRLMDYKGTNPFHVNQAGALSMALATLLLQLSSSYVLFIFFSIFLGFGIGVFNTTVVVLLLRTVEPRLRLYAFPIGEMFTAIGNFTGPPLVGFIADSTGSYKPAFYTAGAILLLSFFLPFLQYYFKPWRTLEMEGQPTQIAYTETRENEDVIDSHQIVDDEVAVDMEMVDENRTGDDTKTAYYVNEAIEGNGLAAEETNSAIYVDDESNTARNSTKRKVTDEPFHYENEVFQSESFTKEDDYDTKF